MSELVSTFSAAAHAAMRSLLDFLRGFTGVHAAKLAIPDAPRSELRGEVRKALAADAENRPRCC